MKTHLYTLISPLILFALVVSCAQAPTTSLYQLMSEKGINDKYDCTVLLKIPQSMSDRRTTISDSIIPDDVKWGSEFIAEANRMAIKLFRDVVSTDSSHWDILLRIDASATDKTVPLVGAYKPEVSVWAELITPKGSTLGSFESTAIKAQDGVLVAQRAVQASMREALSTIGMKIFNDNRVREYVSSISADLPSPTPKISSATKSRPKSPVSLQREQRWAVIIGISDYADSRIPSLRYASADAKAFYEWIISPSGGKYAPSRVKLLLDSDATAVNIKSTLFSWLREALEEDMVIIYFAGHGSPESPDLPKNLFLLPYDVRYDNISATGFPMWDIETALKRFITARKVVVIADACHSGGIGQSFDVARRANRGVKINPISSGIQNLSRVGDGICVISASDDKQYSHESHRWGGGHGVFTYFLLNGLAGEADYNEDDIVTLGELTSFLSEQVRRETKNAQSPTVAGRYDPILTISK